MNDTTSTGRDDELYAEFEMYAVPPPPGEWNYILDDTGIKYRRGLVAFRLREGQWPFAATDPEYEHQLRRNRRVAIPPECGAVSVRLAPDCDFFSWGNEYVRVSPDYTVPHHATARLNLWVRRQGGGGMITKCEVHLDLLHGTYRIEGLHPDVPDEVKHQAEVKAAKLSAYFAAEIVNRDGDRQQPVTAFEHREMARNRPGQWRGLSRAHGNPGWTREVGDGSRWLMVGEHDDGTAWWGVFRHDDAMLSSTARRAVHEAQCTDPRGEAGDVEAAKAAADHAVAPEASTR